MADELLTHVTDDQARAMRAAAGRFADDLWTIAGAAVFSVPPGRLIDVVSDALVDRLCASAPAPGYEGESNADPDVVAKYVQTHYTGILWVDLRPFSGRGDALYAIAHQAWRTVRANQRRAAAG